MSRDHKQDHRCLVHTSTLLLMPKLSSANRAFNQRFSPLEPALIGQKNQSSVRKRWRAIHDANFEQRPLDTHT
ncbi:hypothetical protein T265_02406 [Opisthorchis viverrini]|uniref:Uncharacterized protein n=1 Tax=Opisthorchis viverrini TaxID=6198 RepID=A0A074ZV63_OPIVI|nr:hypothetical protein T265_02406 [Opisthorchis viverrini]KER31358.1 hypothetical protein T265_02406 [Opisthorchis viverrini]